MSSHRTVVHVGKDAPHLVGAALAQPFAAGAVVEASPVPRNNAHCIQIRSLPVSMKRVCGRDDVPMPTVTV